MREQFPGENSSENKKTISPEKAKGFYKFDQEIIESGRLDERYKTDAGFRIAIDIKALNNEIIRMAPIELDYSKDDTIENLLKKVKEFEDSQNIELKGVTVRLRDMLDTKDTEERKKTFHELTNYLSGIDSGMDIVIGKIKEN